MNATTSLKFGQLNWNISKEVSNILDNTTNYLNISGVFFEITIIIFFIGNFCQKNSYFRRPYFVILTIGCIVDALPKLFLFLTKYIIRNVISSSMLPALYWYNENFVTLCNLILALNRFSAIMFPLKFSKIWSKRNSTIICIFLIFYPVLIHSFNPLNVYYTFLNQPWPPNVAQTQFEYYFGFASDIIYAILATSVLIFAALKMKLQSKIENKNTETVLLAQSLTSSVFLIFSTITSWLASINRIPAEVIPPRSETTRILAVQLFFINLSKLFYSFHHYTGLVLLVTMSVNFRTKYFNFYKINFLLPKCYNKVTPQPNMTTTVITLTNRPHSF